MGALSPILRNLQWGKGGKALSFWCPGCNSAHSVVIQRGSYRPDGPVWGWNGSAEAPTFTPSLLVTSGKRVDPSYQPDPDFPDPPECCHSFIADGQIQFLGDCTHALAGQTVPIPPWPDHFHDGDCT